jgi:uncharacterized protein
MYHLPITLTIAGAAALVNIWLMIRCGQVRSAQKINIGDGGDDRLIRRMRAHANFIESAPIVLILIAALELARGQAMWLWIVGIAFIFGRLAHGLGMDGGTFGPGRMIGTLISMLTMLGLAVMALYFVYTAPDYVTVIAPANYK